MTTGNRLCACVHVLCDHLPTHPPPPPKKKKKLPKLGTHPLGKIKKIVQNLVHEIVQKNSPKNSPRVQWSSPYFTLCPWNHVDFNTVHKETNRIEVIKLLV